MHTHAHTLADPIQMKARNKKQVKQYGQYRKQQFKSEGRKEGSTSLGAIRDDKVRVFSGGGPTLLAATAIITKQSPERTAFTFPLYHPEPPAVDDAISQQPRSTIFLFSHF